MKLWQLFIILSAIYTSQVLDPIYATVMGAVCLVIAIIAAFKE